MAVARTSRYPLISFTFHLPSLRGHSIPHRDVPQHVNSDQSGRNLGLSAALQLLVASLAEVGQHRVRISRIPAEVGRLPAGVGRFQAKFGRNQATLGQLWASSVDYGANSAFLVKLGRLPANLGRFRAGRIRATFGRIWASLVDSGPNSAESDWLRTKHRRANLVEFGDHRLDGLAHRGGSGG